MEATTDFTGHILVRAVTTSEWDSCDFAIINVDQYLIDTFVKGQKAMQLIGQDYDVLCITYFNTSADFYVANEDFDIDSFLSDKTWSFVKLEKDEDPEQMFTVPENRFDCLNLKVFKSNIAVWSTYGKYTNEEFYTLEIPMNKIIEMYNERQSNY